MRLRGNVQWDDTTQSATAVKGGTIVHLDIGSTEGLVNGLPWQLHRQ